MKRLKKNINPRIYIKKNGVEKYRQRALFNKQRTNT